VLKQVIKKVLSLIFDESLPSLSVREKDCLCELQTAFRRMPVLEIGDASPSEAVWINNANRLRELVLHQDPRKFLKWDMIARTMFVANAPYILKELEYLKRRPDWGSRWRDAITESSVGYPTRYPFYPATSGNLIHHAYHLAQYEEKVQCQVQNMDCVFEFGSGYGSMCRLFYNLGFRGRYISFDLPAFSALQRYFLKMLDCPVRSFSEFSTLKNGILCSSDIQELNALNADDMKRGRTMFIGTWSVSELPLDRRGPILSYVSDFQSFLIGYKDNFHEINNVDFFQSWSGSDRNIDWYHWQIEHMPGNSYLIGVAR